MCLHTVIQNNIQYSVGISSNIKWFKFKVGEQYCDFFPQATIHILINQNTLLISVFKYETWHKPITH